MSGRVESKWRWRFAGWLNDRFDGFCWSDLVGWVQVGAEPRDRCTRWWWRREGYTLRNCYVSKACRTTANAHPNPDHRSCYCGKVGLCSPRENPTLYSYTAADVLRTAIEDFGRSS